MSVIRFAPGAARSNQLANNTCKKSRAGVSHGGSADRRRSSLRRPPHRFFTSLAACVDGRGTTSLREQTSGAVHLPLGGFCLFEEDAMSSTHGTFSDRTSDFSDARREAGKDFSDARRDAGKDFSDARKEAGKAVESAGEAGSKLMNAAKSSASNLASSASDIAGSA